MVLTRGLRLRDAGGRVRHRRLPRGDDGRDRRLASRRATSGRSPTRSSSCSSDEPRRAALGEAARRARASSATRGTTSRGGSSRSTSEAVAALVSIRAQRLWFARALVVLAAVGVFAALWWRGPAWGGVADAFSSGRVALGRRRGRPEPALGPRACARVADRDRAGVRPAAPELHARLRRVLRRALRERGAAGTHRRARAGRGAQPAHAAGAAPGRACSARSSRTASSTSLP